MTIEQEFYKCFGIEPKYIDACTVEDKYWENEELANKYITFDRYMEAKCGNQEECSTLCSCAYTKEVYPPITDRILLELICINSAFGGIEIRHTYTIEELKNAMLEHTIERYGYSLNKKKYFEQVQQLFKEKEQ